MPQRTHPPAIPTKKGPGKPGPFRVSSYRYDLASANVPEATGDDQAEKAERSGFGNKVNRLRRTTSMHRGAVNWVVRTGAEVRAVRHAEEGNRRVDARSRNQGQTTSGREVRLQGVGRIGLRTGELSRTGGQHEEAIRSFKAEHYRIR